MLLILKSWLLEEDPPPLNKEMVHKNFVNILVSNVCFQTCYYFTDSIGEYHDIAMSLCGELKNGKVPLGKFISLFHKTPKISRSVQMFSTRKPPIFKPIHT